MRTFRICSPIVFDNDCLASFLWVDRFDLLETLFAGERMMVPQQVVNELKYLQHTRSGVVFQRLVCKLQSGAISPLVIPVSSADVVNEYRRLTTRRVPLMGSGESAALAWLRFNQGTLASNNLSDVARYCMEHSIELISTDDILCLCVVRSLLDESAAARIWAEMKSRKRRLPPYDFPEAFRRFLMNLPK